MTALCCCPSPPLAFTPPPLCNRRAARSTNAPSGHKLGGISGRPAERFTKDTAKESSTPHRTVQRHAVRHRGSQHVRALRRQRTLLPPRGPPA
jgi:hypothetical protein